MADVIFVSEELAKAHNSGYVRKDGVYVKPFDDKRTKKAKVTTSKFKGEDGPPPLSKFKGKDKPLSFFGFSLKPMGPKPVPKAYHPAKNDNGSAVGIFEPSKEDLSGMSDPSKSVTITPGSKLPKSLNGVAFSDWTPPGDNEEWDYVEGQKDDLDEPPMHLPLGKKAATGMIVLEPDGRVWVVSPTNQFGGYKNTFPKGKVEDELSFQANAIKETWEECGIKAEVIGLLGDVTRTTSVTRYYLAKRTAGNPSKVGWESQAVHLVPISDIYRFMDSEIDHKVADLLAQERDR